MAFVEYLLRNYVFLFEVFGLVLMLFISVHVSKRFKRFTRVAALLLLLASIAQAAEAYTQTLDHLTMWRPFLTAMKYSLYPAVLLLLIELIASMTTKIPWKWNLVLFAPEAICVPMFLASQWSHIVCYYTEPNNYHGGPLASLPYVLFFVYLAVFLVFNFLYLRKYSLRNRFIALFITLGSVGYVVLFFILNQTGKLPADLADQGADYTPMFAASLVFYFLFLYIHMASIDPLTGLLNRQSYYQDAKDRSNKITFVASVDMNDLKSVNDTYGHDAGDKALCALADVLRTASKAKAYRVGGDEFILLYLNADSGEVSEDIARMAKELEETPYRCAFGVAAKESGMTVGETLKAADQKMYAQKKALKNE